MMAPELLLFTTRPAVERRALAGGVEGIVIDCERLGKEERQAGADTLVSSDTVADLERMRASVAAPLICRLDRVGPWTEEQVRVAVALGADELLVPMVRDADEVEQVLAFAGDRCGIGILFETLEALENGNALAALPLSRVQVGLNDLAIARRTPSIFTAIADGTVEELRLTYAEMQFGFGGATVPDAGYPVPSALILGELMRLGADFTFLRRSFWRDTAVRDPAAAVESINSALAVATCRDPQAVDRDHAQFVCALEELSGRRAATA